MPKLILLVGPPGSGKTTLAKQYESEGFLRINQDDQGREQHLVLFEQAIKLKLDIIVDRLNFVKVQRDRYLNPAKEAGYETRIVVLHVPRKTCMERCLARTDHPTIKDSKDASQAISMFFGKYERVQDSEADIVERLGWNEEVNPIIICDLDGTLCDTYQRQHFVNPGVLQPGGKYKKDWVSFFNAMDKDPLNKKVATTVRVLARDYQVVFASGRPDTYRAATENWLSRYQFSTHIYPLYMRPRNDSRDDTIVKEIILDFEILPLGQPYICFDDRDRVVQMWRNRGYTCFQVASGNF